MADAEFRQTIEQQFRIQSVYPNSDAPHISPIQLSFVFERSGGGLGRIGPRIAHDVMTGSADSVCDLAVS